MSKPKLPDIVITGLGVTSCAGQGKNAFLSTLLSSQNVFAVMQRPGRQLPAACGKESNMRTPSKAFIGAEIGQLSVPKFVPTEALRTASFSCQTAIATVAEAWQDANLEGVNPERIGLVIGGSNFQQRELNQVHELYRGRAQFVRPSYGMSFLDSDICGLCSELFGIRGFAYTVGAGSASGQLAVIQAVQAIQSGQVDACIALGALMDISFWECQALQSLGAMGSNKFADQPELACRPFDKERDGFIFGESCGAIVIERHTANRTSNPYARLTGWAVAMDGNRNPNPSVSGEVRAIRKAMEMAKLSASNIDYVNLHGTGSIVGDDIELRAIKHCGLTQAFLNTTKSIIGHGLSAAGAVELIATALQMRNGRLHPCRNLDTPIEPSYNWVRSKTIEQSIGNALSLSLGFGGINSAVCIQKY